MAGSALAKAPAHQRVESANYVSNGAFIAGHGNLIGQHGDDMTLPEDSTPIVFQPKPGDREVHFEIQDQAGSPTVLLVHQDVPGSHHGLNLEFCATSGYFDLAGTKPLEIRILSGFCRNHLFGVATIGTVTATFSR
jgi:hypothetical protein